MAVVRVLPAKSESAVVDNHDEHDLPPYEVSLMMRKNGLKVEALSTAVAGIYEGGADLMARQRYVFQRSKIDKEGSNKFSNRMRNSPFNPTRSYESQLLPVFKLL